MGRGMEEISTEEALRCHRGTNTGPGAGAGGGEGWWDAPSDDEGPGGGAQRRAARSAPHSGGGGYKSPPPVARGSSGDDGRGAPLPPPLPAVPTVTWGGSLGCRLASEPLLQSSWFRAGHRQLQRWPVRLRGCSFAAVVQEHLQAEHCQGSTADLLFSGADMLPDWLSLAGGRRAIRF